MQQGKDETALKAWTKPEVRRFSGRSAEFSPVDCCDGSQPS